MLNDLCAAYLRTIRIDDVMTHLARLTEHDRYQASLGIERAAELIAEAAKSIGLQDVTIDRFVADGSTSWWTFQAPRAWTPTIARLEVRAGDVIIVAVDHATRPFTIATYSAAAELTTRVARFTDDVRGALVVIGPADFARPTLVAELVARGAVGFVTDGPSRHGQPGRIELASDATLFAFSITTAQREAIESALSGVSGMAGMHDLQIASAQIASRISSSTPVGEPDTRAHLHIEIDRSAHMPVVTGVLPGRLTDEVWLTSHLCHPRPGANDNASGAAGLLGVAAALVGRRDFDRSVRFVWGPEFVGVAALIHQRYGAVGRDARPVAVINLDMIGEDPVQCGVPLVVERPPDWCLSLLAPLAEHVAERVFTLTSADVGTWRAGPFYGFSDHALFANFADVEWRSPAVQLWHPGDPFNHSAADTLDKVSPIQMRRAIAIGAVLADVLARDGVTRDVLAHVVDEWSVREAASATAVAVRFRERGAWPERFLTYTRERAAAMRSLVDIGLSARLEPPRRTPRAFSARWPGPFNYRGLLAASSNRQRDEVVALFLADKRNYAVLTHLAMLAETCESRDETIDVASFALRAPIDEAAAHRLWSALCEVRWLAEVDA
ncbi:MAG TPA: DUF4910 domain-containing protein [Kofleriaceae bacterium]